MAMQMTFLVNINELNLSNDETALLDPKLLGLRYTKGSMFQNFMDAIVFGGAVLDICCASINAHPQTA